jgi:NADH-quinone oxidoreductase subunit L
LQVVAWVGAGTAVLAAGIAVAQADMKRILAYSTVSQLGFMMLGLGVGGVAVGMFHLMTHAAFKALLFLGAGSVIHGAHEEQDIRRLGGLWRAMPITFATYAIGMMALAGVPLAASGFWSKDAILHAAHGWPVSQGPFALGLVGVLLTAFYMTRQVCHVFFGRARNPRVAPGRQPAAGGRLGAECASVRESPPLMTVPLLGLAGVTLLAGLVGTPVWPWFQGYLEGSVAGVDWTRLWRGETLVLMAGSGTIVAIGVTAGWWWYGRTPLAQAHDPDVLERWWPSGFALLRDRLRFDELYDVTAVRGTDWFAAWCDRLDFLVWGAAVAAVEWLVLGLSWASHLFDQHVVNLGFDTSCERLRRGGRFASALQDGQAQNYLCALAGGLVLLLLLLNWDAGR